VGHISNAKVYSLMVEQTKLQHQNVTQRKLIIGLSVFAVILALANMGTAFAAATLAKDTTISGPPSTASSNSASSGSDQQPMSWANGVPEDAMIAKKTSGIVGTKQVAATQVTLDLARAEEEESEGGKGTSFACLPLIRVTDMYNRIAEGSAASIVTRNADANADLGEMETKVETVDKAGVSGGDVMFFNPGVTTRPSIVVALGNDVCDQPADRSRNLRASEHRRLARARGVKDMFRRLTHPDPRVRREAETALEGGGDASPVAETDGAETDAPVSEGNDTDADSEVDAGQNHADWLAEAMGLGEPDTSFFDNLPGNPNRVGLVPVFYFDFLGEETPAYVP